MIRVCGNALHFAINTYRRHTEITKIIKISVSRLWLDKHKKSDIKAFISKKCFFLSDVIDIRILDNKTQNNINYLIFFSLL